MKRHHKPHAPHAPRGPRLFVEPEKPTDVFVAHIDGASRGNPGPASYAVLILRPNGEVAARLQKAIGQATNNVAEYYALVAALDYAQTHHITKLRIRSDSELLVRQMQGHYRVKSLSLRQLHERARRLAGSLSYFAIEHVPREANREADALANEALDQVPSGFRQHFPRAPEAPSEGPEARKAKLEPHPEKRSIRARYSHGALHPAEPLDLPEDEEVVITIRRVKRGGSGGLRKVYERIGGQSIPSDDP